jgi:hypothetical protein
MSTPEDSYEVGKGRPPRHTRYRKGQSGNPSGRKKRRTFADEYADLLDEEVEISVDGVPTRMTQRRVIARSTLIKAMRGDMRAAAYVIANDNRKDGDDDTVTFETDAALIERALERYARPRGGQTKKKASHE